MKTKRRTYQYGQSLVEFALILPLLMLVLMMIFDAGRAIYYYSVVHNAAREGARYGIILGNPEAGIEGAAESLMIGLGCDYTIDYERVGTATVTCDPNNMVCVEVTCTFVPVTPLVGNFLASGNLTLIGRSEMKVEGTVE
jgi:hypothetical protein